jgi:hypothetical protein
MIKIVIATDGIDVVDNFEKKNTNLQEVGIILLRLKQIEQELIDIKFEEDK